MNDFLFSELNKVMKNPEVININGAYEKVKSKNNEKIPPILIVIKINHNKILIIIIIFLFLIFLHIKKLK